MLCWWAGQHMWVGPAGQPQACPACRHLATALAAVLTQLQQKYHREAGFSRACSADLTTCRWYNHPCRKYREAGFYVSHTPEENDTSEKFYGLGDAGFKDAVMDLTAEDAGGCCCGCRGRGGGVQLSGRSSYAWWKVCLLSQGLSSSPLPTQPRACCS